MKIAGQKIESGLPPHRIGSKMYLADLGNLEGRWANVTRICKFSLHRDSERQLHFDTKFEHEEMVLVA